MHCTAPNSLTSALDSYRDMADEVGCLANEHLLSRQFHDMSCLGLFPEHFCLVESASPLGVSLRQQGKEERLNTPVHLSTSLKSDGD